MCAPAQQTDDTANPATAETPPAHVLWIVPNFRTAPLPEPYAAIAPKEKFRIAAQDIFDRGTIALAIIFAAQGQLTNSNRSFGQGAEGSAHYFVCHDRGNLPHAAS